MNRQSTTPANRCKTLPLPSGLLWLGLPVLALVLAAGTARGADSPTDTAQQPAASSDANDRIMELNFEDLDTDADNLLSREEAARLPGLAEQMDQLDIEQDDQLNRTEFSRFKPASEEMMVYDPDATFDELDSDADNLLTREEADKLPGLSERLDELDIEQDGQLNRTEFSKFEPLERETGPGEDSFERVEQQ